MASNQKLFSVGNFDFRLQHLLVIGILVLSVSISMLTRSPPLGYGNELFEYDPFFNFRATEYLVNNGLDNYLEWYDEKTWHPFGRDISNTSQVTLHLTAAILYPIFNFGASLYNFTILFPLVIGSLTSIVAFALVRVLGGTTAGLFASLIFAISIPVLVRGFAGWFKSEPLGLFFGFLALYLFVSGIKNNKNKISALKLIGAALFLTLSISAWGGSIFFILAIALFLFTLPFFKHEKNFLIWATPVFSIAFIIFSLMFERTLASTSQYVGFAILLPTIFVVISEIIKKFSDETKKIRNCIMFLAAIIVSGIGIFSAGLINLPSFRYQNALNPLLVTTDPLTDSVSEHAVTDLATSFTFLSVFMIFGVIGAWYIFTNKSFSMKNDMRVFSLVVSFFAIYLSSAFIRLELFATLGLLILGGIGLSIFFNQIFKLEKTSLKIITSSIILILFIVPVTLPSDNNWTNWADFAPTIVNGGTAVKTFESDDWFKAMDWVKENTPENSVIAAWWDYGYWITTLSDRSTVVDNATLIDWQIKKMAYSLLSEPNVSWHILSSHYDDDISSSYSPEFSEQLGNPKPFIDMAGQAIPKNCRSVTAIEHNLTGTPLKFCHPVISGMDVDYVLVYATAEKIAAPGLDLDLYHMIPGGDESKKHWLAKIAGMNVSDMVLPDGITPTAEFMQNTTLGQMFPFQIVTYVDPSTDMIHDNWEFGHIPIYGKIIKFNDVENDPFSLVYASPSFYAESPGQKNMIFIYKINPDYQY